MNIEILAAKCRGYECANCFKPTMKGDDGFKLIVHEAKIKVLGATVGKTDVDEDVCRPCGLALHKALSAEVEKCAPRVCVHCGKPATARCYYDQQEGRTVFCCFRGNCIEVHDRACKGYHDARLTK